MEEVIVLAVRLIFAIISVLIVTYLIPWLKEKRLYNTVKKAVEAFEKLSETGVIEKNQKHEKVIEYLKQKGIKITKEIEIFIEASVKELDALTNVISGEQND